MLWEPTAERLNKFQMLELVHFQKGEQTPRAGWMGEHEETVLVFPAHHLLVRDAGFRSP